MLTVIVYDVSSDQRRNRIHALLKEYGVAVQRSAFEARLTPAERTRLLERACAIIDERADRFVAYPVPADQEEKVAVLGLPRPSAVRPPYYLV